MVQAKTVARANVAHKLARYVRATPINLLGLHGASQPSTSHLTLGGVPKKRLRNKANTWYQADDEKRLFKRANNQPKPSQSRKSIVPGSIVILLAGVSRGRRVIVLKSLPSGNLLVTGPYSVNGVPLRRVNQAYVIATSTKISLDGVNANIDDSFFKSARRYTKNQLKNASEHRQKKVETGNQQNARWKNALKDVQKKIDSQLLVNIKKVEHLRGYLENRFTLTNSSRPHDIKF